MTGFTNRPLGILDRIYGFVGGLRGVRGVDLASDITLVHDVSRETEVNGLGGYSGYVLWQGSHFSAGGATVEILERIADVQPAIGRPDEEYELWIMEAHAYSNTAPNFTNLHLAVGRDTGSAPIGLAQHAVRIGPQQPELQPICAWYALTQLEDDLGNDRFTMSTHKPVILPAQYNSVPFVPVRVPLGGFVEWYLNAAAAFTFQYTVRMWAGSLGARPPGIA